MKITAEYFTKMTGNEPTDDDLERCNCKKAGEFGHTFCGWCQVHDLPIFQCGCIKTDNLKKESE